MLLRCGKGILQRCVGVRSFSSIDGNVGRLELILGCMYSGKTTELLRRVSAHESAGLSCVVINSDKDDRYTPTNSSSSSDDQEESETFLKKTKSVDHDAISHENETEAASEPIPSRLSMVSTRASSGDEAVLPPRSSSYRDRDHHLGQPVEFPHPGPLRAGHAITHTGDHACAFSARDLLPILSDARSLKHLEECSLIAIDEAQFFPDLSPFVDHCVVHMGKNVIVAGLDGDYMREPFDNVLSLIPKCEMVTRLNAVCGRCGKDAHFSNRKVDSEERELIGGADKYEALCRGCYEQKG